jgi:DNA polymerase-3 subunit delta'
VVDTLSDEGVDPVRAQLAARLAGGNLGRARRLATATDGLRFREAAERAVALAAEGAAGSLEAATVVLAAAAEYRKGLKFELEDELAPFLDEKGRPEDAYRGSIKRIEIRFQRRERRAERDYVDWVLLAVSSLLRDRIALAVGGGSELLLNPDLVPDGRLSVVRAARGLAGIEEGRADLAEDLNLNPRMLLERAFLRLAELAA